MLFTEQFEEKKIKFLSYFLRGKKCSQMVGYKKVAFIPEYVGGHFNNRFARNVKLFLIKHKP